jgi:predicted Zn-dependent protease
MIMAKAGYNPESAIQIWQRADEIFGAGGGGGSFLSTHPSSSDRLERIQAAMPVALRYYQESKVSSSAAQPQGASGSPAGSKKKAAKLRAKK